MVDGYLLSTMIHHTNCALDKMIQPIVLPRYIHDSASTAPARTNTRSSAGWLNTMTTTSEQFSVQNSQKHIQYPQANKNATWKLQARIYGQGFSCALKGMLC